MRRKGVDETTEIFAVEIRVGDLAQGRSLEDLERTCQHLLRFSPLVEINCGCPSPKVCGHGAGSSFLQNPKDFEKLVGFLAKNIGGENLAIKMRSGFESDKNFSKLLEILEAEKIALLTIHPRTREQKYRGEAQWKLISEASKVF